MPRARPEVASTGVTGLDAALGGMFWGDNVVWELEDGGSLAPFVARLLDVRDQFSSVVVVNLDGDPTALGAAHPDIEVVDARAGSAIDNAGTLLSAVRTRAYDRPRALFLFDSLDALSDRWGGEMAQRFFTRACPLLLGLWSVAYWSLTPSRHGPQLRQAVEATTQCVLVLGRDRLRIAKAEGRPPGVEGDVFRVRPGRGTRPELEPAPTPARLGAALRAVRTEQHLTQRELARLAGVSPSAISQAERGRRGLALHTLLDLTSRLGMTIDELLRGDSGRDYRLARRTRGDDAAARMFPLQDDPRAGLRANLSCLAPGQSVRADATHEGVELVAVATGLVQVLLPGGSPVLRRGETLLVPRCGVRGWRNVGDHDATLFWVLRDELAPPAPAHGRGNRLSVGVRGSTGVR